MEFLGHFKNISGVFDTYNLENKYVDKHISQKILILGFHVCMLEYLYRAEPQLVGTNCGSNSVVKITVIYLNNLPYR